MPVKKYAVPRLKEDEVTRDEVLIILTGKWKKSLTAKQYPHDICMHLQDIYYAVYDKVSCICGGIISILPGENCCFLYNYL